MLPFGAITMRACWSADPRVVVAVCMRKPYRLVLSACIIIAVSSGLVATIVAPSLQIVTSGTRTRSDLECRYLPAGKTSQSPGLSASSAAWIAAAWSLVSLGETPKLVTTFAVLGLVGNAARLRQLPGVVEVAFAPLSREARSAGAEAGTESELAAGAGAGAGTIRFEVTSETSEPPPPQAGRMVASALTHRSFRNTSHFPGVPVHRPIHSRHSEVFRKPCSISPANFVVPSRSRGSHIPLSKIARPTGRRTTSDLEGVAFA